MNCDKLSRILLRTAVAIFLIAAAIRICTYNCNRSQSDTSVEHKADTVRIRDTIRIPHPVPVTSRIVDSIPVPVPVTDTLWLHDTLYINLPREQLTYTDSTYTAWISGYRPQLDSILIYPLTTTINNTTTITHKPKKPNISIGIQAGYGVSIVNNQVHPSPYFGIGINYPILSW